MQSPDDFWPEIIIWPSNPIKKLIAKTKYAFKLLILKIRLRFGM